MFFLALGDLDYNETDSDEAWCDYVKQRLPTLGPTFPFELVAGTHEDQGASDGYIMNHAACLPDRLGASGVYGAQYYFDFPLSSPLVRVIMISPHLTIENIHYTYETGSAEYDWLSATIDNARSTGIPWVVTGMHVVCLTGGIKKCEMGPDLMNLLVSKRVDLVLQGHDHNYQRSKQLSHRTNCLELVPGGFDQGCVVDSGADASYAKGAGTVFIITGNFGRCCYATSGTDAEAGYFAKMDSTSAGYTTISVGSSRLEAEFVPSSGSFTDWFSVASGVDSDGDGFSDGIEAYAGTDPGDNCGAPEALGPPSPAWTADLNSGSGSTNEVDISDLATYVAPIRRNNTAAGHPNYDVRWDVNGNRLVNIQDLAAISILRPPMFSGARAFNGPSCSP